MSQRTSIIKHKEYSKLILLRQDFIEICDGDHCMAALLSYYEYEINAIISIIEGKVTNNANYKPDTNDYFIQSSPSYLSKAMLGLFGRTKIIASNEKLLERNYIKIKIEKVNKLNYMPTMISLNISEVNLAIDRLSKNEQPPYPKTNNPLSKNEQPLIQKRTTPLFRNG